MREHPLNGRISHLSGGGAQAYFGHFLKYFSSFFFFFFTLEHNEKFVHQHFLLYSCNTEDAEALILMQLK